MSPGNGDRVGGNFDTQDESGNRRIGRVPGTRYRQGNARYSEQSVCRCSGAELGPSNSYLEGPNAILPKFLPRQCSDTLKSARILSNRSKSSPARPVICDCLAISIEHDVAMILAARRRAVLLAAVTAASLALGA